MMVKVTPEEIRQHQGKIQQLAREIGIPIEAARRLFWEGLLEGKAAQDCKDWALHGSLRTTLQAVLELLDSWHPDHLDDQRNKQVVYSQVREALDRLVGEGSGSE